MKKMKIIILILVIVLVLLLIVVWFGTRNNTRLQPEDNEQIKDNQSESALLSWEEYQTLTLEEQDAFFREFGSVEEFEKWMDSVKPTEDTVSTIDWNLDGKQPDQYTWKEYQALSPEYQDAFFRWFASAADFEAWLESVKPAQSTEPIHSWSEKEKKPDKYTWEEYQALSPAKREAFYQWFVSAEAFAKWMNSVKPSEETEPTPIWNKTGKTPDEYTWEEYQKLDKKDQIAFFLWFGDADQFEKWVESVKTEETAEPFPSWNKLGKPPNEYTWEEYQMLSLREQDAFYLWFGSVDSFEQWRDSVKPSEETEPTPTWNKPGKTPDEYTWEEYQKLDKKDQDAFSLWFGAADQFEKWVESVKPEETTEPLPSWNKPGKPPNEYTWEEYQMLSLQEQDAFYLWFGSVDRFEQWRDSVKPSETTEPTPTWNKPGKTPDEYTWEEYQKLSPEEQDAFFMWFENVTAFEAWMEAARGEES